MTSLLRPELRDHADAAPVDKSTPPRRAAEQLRDGTWLRVRDDYATGLAVLRSLHKLLDPPSYQASYPVRRAFRQAFREASVRLIVQVSGGALRVSGAPENGFLRELYPESSAFSLSFVDAEDLAVAWRWYDEGVHLPVLGYRLHPFYGTYAPARVTHLELFATWLTQFKGDRNRAIDVGTGSGVLALMLCKMGFEHVVATDANPNAVESLRRECARFAEPPPISLRVGDLLAECEGLADVIVFNPPWMFGVVEGPLDRALYYEDDLFERFFDQALDRLAPGGRVVLVFSNLISLVQPDVPHPIETELAKGRFNLVQKLRRKVKPTQTKTGDRPRRTKEKVEVWELERA